MTRAEDERPALPWLMSDSSHGEFHTKCAAQASTTNRANTPSPLAPTDRAALSDEVGETEAQEPGEEHVAVEPGEQHPHEERADDRPHCPPPDSPAACMKYWTFSTTWKPSPIMAP